MQKLQYLWAELLQYEMIYLSIKFQGDISYILRDMFRTIIK